MDNIKKDEKYYYEILKNPESKLGEKYKAIFELKTFSNNEAFDFLINCILDTFLFIKKSIILFKKLMINLMILNY